MRENTKKLVNQYKNVLEARSDFLFSRKYALDENYKAQQNFINSNQNNLYNEEQKKLHSAYQSSVNDQLNKLSMQKKEMETERNKWMGKVSEADRFMQQLSSPKKIIFSTGNSSIIRSSENQNQTSNGTSMKSQKKDFDLITFKNEKE